MSIGPLAQYLLGQQQNAAKSSTPAYSNPPAGDQDPTDPQSIIAEIANGGSAGLLKYQEKEIAKKAREAELKALGLTDKQLASLPPDQQQTVEAAIKKAVEQAIKKALGADGQGGSDGSTQAGVSSANGLISSGTLSSLLSLQ